MLNLLICMMATGVELLLIHMYLPHIVRTRLYSASRALFELALFLILSTDCQPQFITHLYTLATTCLLIYTLRHSHHKSEHQQSVFFSNKEIEEGIQSNTHDTEPAFIRRRAMYNSVDGRPAQIRLSPVR